jgi:drug/metabolite transporter (DMT)-like permease
MSSPLGSFRSGLLLAILGAMGLSAKAIIVKLSYRHGVDAMTVVMFRMLFALPFFIALGIWSERLQHAKDNPLNRTDWQRIAALGFVGYYLSSYLDFLGLQYTSASLERLILYLNPTMVMLLGWVLYKKAISRIRAGAMMVSYSGVLLVFGQELSLAGGNVALGGVLVLGSAVSYALYLLYSGQWVARIGSVRLVGWATSVACMCCIGQFVLLRPLSDADVPVEVLKLAGLNAVFCTVIPMLMIMMAIERLGAGLAAQTGMLGSMLTMGLGMWFLDEPLNGWILLGIFLVLVGVYMVTKYGAK